MKVINPREQRPKPLFSFEAILHRHVSEILAAPTEALELADTAYRTILEQQHLTNTLIAIEKTHYA